MMQNVKASLTQIFAGTSSGSSVNNISKTSQKSFDDIITGSLKNNKDKLVSNGPNERSAAVKESSASLSDSKQPKKVLNQANKVSGNEASNNTITPNTEDAAQSVNQPEDAVEADNGNTDAANLLNLQNLGLTSIEDILNAIKSSIQKKLGISEEDMNKALEALGFTPLNLLDVNNLKQFLLQVSNNDDSMAFLTNEDLGNNLKELLKVCDTIKEQFSISKEQIPLLTQQAAEMNTVNSTMKTNTAEVNSTGQEAFDITVVKSMNSEAAVSSEGSKKSGDGKAEHNLSASELMIQNLAVNTATQDVAFNDQLARTQQIREITSQILEAIRINIKPEQTSMELQLNPENLGRINLTVVAKDGILTAKFVTGTETAKEAIESQLQVFKENLNNQGLKVENVEVTVSYSALDRKSQEFSEGGGKEDQNKQKNKLFKDINQLNDTFSDIDETETAGINDLDENTSSINYTV
ncbi:flagellar hook-length control protein FliK [Anaerocolumna sp. AGMB13020]|uniref:flagellar hook-length control protein FliK n=1 Tax=Anaerocolumna sp. AGMB13020 TaxID=3081750 RepID=UPI002952F287|nr:flagellar hook-length control protein FliK [Anaerocolumna sp. AGMB13020]WOO36532.1 flagellar hook-length control protein FliK [Anaerocolumna sp. AGMB13020]